MRRSGLLLSLLLILFPLQSFAAVELVLKDGRRVRGESVERRGDLYLLRFDGDLAVAFPRLLVSEIRMGDPIEPDGNEPASADREGEVVPPETPDVESDSPPEADAEETEEPEETERAPYDATRLPDRSEQLEVFGEASKFPSPPVDTSWRPTDSLGRLTDVTEFNPSTWYRSSYDPAWSPTSGFARAAGPPDFNPSRWYQPRLRSTWRPRSGWGPTEWFPSVISTRD